MRSKLVVGLLTAGLFLAGFGGAVLPASAEPHHYLLTLANGTKIFCVELFSGEIAWIIPVLSPNR